jgi:hypothetical protein
LAVVWGMLGGCLREALSSTVFKPWNLLQPGGNIARPKERATLCHGLQAVELSVPHLGNLQSILKIVLNADIRRR